MRSVKPVSEELKRGRRALDELESVMVIHDWQWDTEIEKWHLKLRVTVECEAYKYVPNSSFWYVVVDDSYPLGNIKIYPSKNDCFEITLYHQSNNGLVADNQLWRTGNLCLDSSMKSLRRIGNDEEPSNVDERILWHVERAIDWIYCANSGKLVTKNDPFELPDFDERLFKIIAFNEDVVSYMQWESIESNYGFVDLVSNGLNSSVIGILAFLNNHNEIIFHVKWGSFFSDYEKNKIERSKGIWVMLDRVPTVRLWQAPNSLEELFEACDKLDFDLMTILEKSAHEIRDGKNHYLLIGFPIPKYFGGDYEIIHWKAIRLPILSYGKKAQNGFRQNEKGYWLRDKLSILKLEMKLDWMVSQNWNENDINNRGRVNKSLRSNRILIIGAGAVGAAIAELLTREGVYNIHIQDYDILEIGNLTRHSLDVLSIGKSKAEELVKYLHRLNPNSIASAINTKFVLNSNSNELLEKYDLILDCTGEDRVLSDISRIEFKREKIFASVSIGFAATRLYILLQKSNQLEVNNFFDEISPFQSADREVYKEYEFPRDGVGCWSPLFPARQDDILVAASIFIKALEKFLDYDNEKKIVKVFNQYYDDEGYFLGYREAKNMYE